MRALAIDLGTTAAKVSVVAIDGTVLGSGTVGVHTVFGADGSAEQDAEAVWEAVLSAASTALAQAGPDATRSVNVLCASSQWSSIVPVGPDGSPIAPMMTWLDGRGSKHTEPLLDGAVGAANRSRWNEVHGLNPSTSLGHVLRFQSDRPDVHEQATAYLEPVDYLNARFTGQIVATGCSAMPLSLTDNRTLGTTVWSDELIGLAGVDKSKLPPLVRSMSTLGPILPAVADRLGLSRDVVVVAGSNDSCAAAIGTNALGPGEATLIMGTTGVLTAHHPTRIVQIDKFIVTMPSALNDRYYVMAEGGLGGKVLETFLGQVLLADDALDPHPGRLSDDVFDRAGSVVEQVPPGCEGLLFLPWMIGSLSPAPDSRQRGAFLGMSMHTTRAHMLRAVLEGTALQMRWLTDTVSEVLGVPMPTIRFGGGGAQSDTWAQIMADVLGRPVEQIAEPRQANARGAGLLAYLSIGALTVDDLKDLIPIRRVYEPNPSTRALFDERLAIMRDLHDRLGEPTARLHARR
jgi:xylulokinase